jgi:hypothetical protein
VLVSGVVFALICAESAVSANVAEQVAFEKNKAKALIQAISPALVLIGTGEGNTMCLLICTFVSK